MTGPLSGAAKEADSAPSRADTWSRYWASGAEHSCVGSLPPDYGPTIRTIWDREFEALPADSRTLDIGTGSGVLAKLWAAHPASRRGISRLDAIDLVETAPPWFASLRGLGNNDVTFHGATRAEQLPFPDASFDLAISQYGFEYADAERACPELRRVLRPTGRLLLVVHHADSAPVAYARQDLAHARWMLAAGGLAEAASALLPAMALSATPEGRDALARDPAAGDARRRVNVLMGDLAERASAPGGDLCHEAGVGLQSVFTTARHAGLEAGKSAHHAWLRNLSDALLRAEELVACARDGEGIGRLAAALGGSASDATPLFVDQTLFGWRLSIHATSRAPSP